MPPFIRDIRTAILLLLFVALISGCAKTPARTARVVEGSRTAEAQKLEQRLVAFRDATPTLKGLAWIELLTEEEDRRTEAALVVERPNRIRIDAMDSLADVWAQAGSDGGVLWLHLPGRHKLYEGRATRRTLHKLASFDWEPADLVSIIAGLPPLGDAPELLQVGTARDRHFVARGTAVHLWTEGKGLRVVRCVRYAEDGVSTDYDVAFSEYRRAGGAEFPHRIEASFPSRKARILVDYRDVQLGGTVDPAAFQSPTTSGGTRERVRGE